MTITRERAFESPANKLNKLIGSAWQSILVTGILSAVLGILILAWPGPTLVVAGILFGIYLMSTGLLQLISAFGAHVTVGLRILTFISGILALVLGLLCFNSTFESILLLATWIGIGWLFRGVALLVAAISDADTPARGWQIFFGVVIAIDGGVMIAIPFGSIAVLTLVAGWSLIAIGILEAITAFQLRHTASQARAAIIEARDIAPQFRSETGDLLRGA